VAQEASWFVADRACFEQFQAAAGTDFSAATVLKEWEIVADALRREPRVGRIGEWERRLKVQTLWPAAIADRRLFMGTYCKAVQDYQPRYAQQQLESILVTLCETLLKIFTEQRPDVVFSFGPTTAGAMVAAYMARSHGIPFLTMKPTKISNLVSFSDEWDDKHPHIKRIFEHFTNPAAMQHSVNRFATAYLDEAKSIDRLKYEGVLATRRVTFSARLGEIGRHVLSFARGLASDVCFLAAGRFDPQRSPQTGMQYHLGFGRELRMLQARPILARASVDEGALRELDFIFYPLNSEPEIALSVYSRNFRNQIEVARSLAESLPMGMRLVIKEHPRSWGVRSPGYYRKLLEIPNVLIAPVEMRTSDIIPHAQAVAVLSSFVGFEALVQNKPVVLFGSCIYDFLPEPLVWKVPRMEALPQILAEACRVELNGKAQLHRFIAAVREGSVPIDLYSSMLRKSNRALGTINISEDLQIQYVMLAEYAMRRYQESTSVGSV
jgi:hypothetical protein